MKNIEFGKRLREVRGNKSLPDFAQILDVHRSTIVRWEREESYPDADLIKKICEIYHIDPTWLIMGKPINENHSEKYLATTRTTRIVEILNEIGIDLPTEKMVQFVTKLYDLQLKEDQQGVGLQNITL